MRLTAFFKLYKICILLHRCNLKIFAKNRFEKISNFRENSAKCLQMSHILQNLAKILISKNLVDFEKCCKTHIDLQKSVPIQPKTSENLQKFAKNLQLPYGSQRNRKPWRSRARSRSSGTSATAQSSTAPSPWGGGRLLQIFGGLVLGCIKTKFCKKICV